MSRTIVLIYPRFEPDFPDPKKRIGLPLAPLTVARPLVKAGYNVKIIEHSQNRAKAIARRLDKAIVLQGDAADEAA